MRQVAEIEQDPAFAPRGRAFCGRDQRVPLREALIDAGEYGACQSAGRFYPVACVALEITQRCNLDCTLCYLSENAELSHDVPLAILFQRIAMVADHYGPGTTIQITGGDPTLRKLEDIEALCVEISRLKLRSCLMTNGIKATRPFLKRLALAGLDDVAFHVDLTQERKGYDSEVALNDIRRSYIARAKGLGLRILFNATIYHDNLDEVPELARFYRESAPDLALVSFQMQADTGRGVDGRRDRAMTLERVSEAISEGLGVPFPSKIGTGHSECNRFDHLLVAGDEAVSLLNDDQLIGELFQALENADTSGMAVAKIRTMVLGAIMARPGLAFRALMAGPA